MTQEVNLTAVKGLGPTRRDALIEKFGSVQGVLEAKREDLLALDGVSPTIADRIEALAKGEDPNKVHASKGPGRPKKKAATKRTKRSTNKNKAKSNGNGKLSLTAGDIRLIAKQRGDTKVAYAVSDLFDHEAVPADRFA